MKITTITLKYSPLFRAKTTPYALLSTYDGLGEMELENKRLFDDEDYIELIGTFFLENMKEGSMYTQIYRGLSDKKNEKKDDGKKKKNNKVNEAVTFA